MEKIRIESKLTSTEYIRLMFRLTYKRPIFIFITVVGLIMLVSSALYFLGLFTAMDRPPYFQLGFGLFALFFLPFSVYRSAKRNFDSHKRLKEKIIYVFDEEKISISGDSFASEMDWPQTHKVLELNNWILIYQNKLVANVIPKKAFKNNDLKEFKELLQNMPRIKSKLKR
ncbi:MAG: YcxB family protein [Bacteroidota bacterium]